MLYRLISLVVEVVVRFNGSHHWCRSCWMASTSSRLVAVCNGSSRIHESVLADTHLGSRCVHPRFDRAGKRLFIICGPGRSEKMVESKL